VSLFFSALPVTLAFAIAAHAADVRTVVARPQLRAESADYRATGHLVRVDASDVRTSYAITLKARGFPDGMRVLLEITSPNDARVHILLNMRTHGHTTIQVAHPGDAGPVTMPFDKWNDGPLGAGFSYEDFLEPQYFWKSQILLKKTKYGARECDLLKSMPGPSERTHYAEVRTWLDQSIGYPVYAEKTLKKTGTVKEFTYFGLRQNGGVWSASQVEVKTRGEAGSTLLIIDRGSAKANLDLREFSPEQFIHF
jgi:hypothetical protein